MNEALAFALTAAISAGVGLLGSALLLFFHAQRMFRSLEEASSETKFEEAFETLNIETIGKYISSEFGSVSLDVYSRDERIRMRLDRVLSRIVEFVDQEPPADGAEVNAPEVVPHQAEIMPDLVALPTDPQPIRAALAELAAGNSWNALARLRRDIEVDVRRELGGSSKMPIRNIVANSKLPRVALDHLEYVYRVASRVIHGEDVTFDVAMEAIHSARLFYEFLSDAEPDEGPQLPN